MITNVTTSAMISRRAAVAQSRFSFSFFSFFFFSAANGAGGAMI
jgi:hypothetical protein